MRIRLLLGLWVAGLILSPALYACSCASVGPPCQEAWESSTGAVFVGEVTGVTKWKARFGLSRDFEVHFNVLGSFKGIDRHRVTVRTGVWAGDCGFPFEIGRKYMVYAHRNGSKLSTSICTRTQPLENAHDDVAYFRSVPNLPETGRIYGTVKRYTHDKDFVPKYVPNLMDHYFPPEEYMVAVAPMPGVAVTVQSDTNRSLQWVTHVDAAGGFEFEGLQPDAYLVHVELPSHLTQPGVRVAGIVPKGCARIHFRTESDGWIRGRVLDAEGQPIPDLLISVVDADERQEKDRPFKSSFSSGDGSYAIGPLPARRYLLGINITKTDKLMSANRGIPTTFFSGQPDAKEATPIVLGDGEKKDGFLIRLPLVRKNQP